MHDERALSPGAVRYAWLVNMLPCAAAVLIAWSLYLANVWFGFDLRPREGRDPHRNESLYLWLATISTPIALLFGWWRTRTALLLARRGVEVEATVDSTGIVGSRGLVRVNCSYEFNGRTYEYAFSGPRKDFPKGKTIVLIVDPQRPSRCRQSHEVVSPLAASTAEQADGDDRHGAWAEPEAPPSDDSGEEDR